MSNRMKMKPGAGLPRQWLIRIQRQEPFKLDDKEYFRGTWKAVQRRAWLSAHRASYQVSGPPHAEVFISIEIFDPHKVQYITAWEAKSRCRPEATAK